MGTSRVLTDFPLFSPRFDSEKAGDREVQRTMLELLNQLDGFQPNTQVKVTPGLHPAKTINSSSGAPSIESCKPYVREFQESERDSCSLSGNSCNQPGGYPGPCFASLWTVRSQN